MSIASFQLEQGDETMKTSTETTLSYFVVGLAVGAIGGFVAALVAPKETRGLLRERSAKSLE